MSGSYRLIVTDTSPLFTLVLANRLTCCCARPLRQHPDAVYRRRGARCAGRSHLEWITIISTRCASFRQMSISPSREARAFYFEDTDIERRRAVVGERVDLAALAISCGSLNRRA